MKRIHFVDQAQDLISLDLKHMPAVFGRSLVVKFHITQVYGKANV